MIVLGVDPGSSRTGYCVLRVEGGKFNVLSSGIIKPKGSQVDRLRFIYNGFLEILDRFSPDTVAIESVFYGKNFRSAMRLGEVKGVIMLAAGVKDVEVFEYLPAEIKINVVGNGSATKEQVRYMVSQILDGFSPSVLDESDAAAVAICHVFKGRAS